MYKGVRRRQKGVLPHYPHRNAGEQPAEILQEWGGGDLKAYSTSSLHLKKAGRFCSNGKYWCSIECANDAGMQRHHNPIAKACVIYFV